MNEKELIERVRNCVLGNLSHPTQTLDICREVKDIEGDFCECGVAFGGMSALMANFIYENNLNKKLHMVDSFEGIPYPTKNDLNFPENLPLPKSGELKSSGISSSSVEDVSKRFFFWGISFDKVFMHKGWIENIIEEVASKIDKLSFLRIDVDLYRPTKLCLEILGPKVSKGGYILMHDPMPGCLKAVEEYVGVTNTTYLSDWGGVCWEVK